MTKWGPEYLAFIESFLSNEMSASAFVDIFFRLNPTIEGQSAEEYAIYMDLFYAADAFNPDGLDIIGPSIGEEELRRAASECFAKLKAVASKPNVAIATYRGKIGNQTT